MFYMYQLGYRINLFNDKTVNTTQTDPLPPFQIDPSKTGAGICLF